VGIAMKINHPDGEQDLLGGAVDRFFCKDAADAVELAQARANRPVRFFFPSLDPRRWRLLELRIMIETATRRVTDLFAATYYSQTTIGCGPQTVKWSLQPTAKRRFTLRRTVQSVADREGTFRLRLQRVQALNDPRQRSSEPWETVGTVHFPAQAVGNGESLTMTPAHCLPEHQPRDEIGEFRAAVYDRISRTRHRLNRDSSA
jgi:hypothetical protein